MSAKVVSVGFSEVALAVVDGTDRVGAFASLSLAGPQHAEVADCELGDVVSEVGIPLGSGDAVCMGGDATGLARRPARGHRASGPFRPQLQRLRPG